MESRTITDDEILEVFEMLDEDRSDKLEMSELGRAFNLLGLDFTADEVTNMYNSDDDPASLSYEEFKQFFRERVDTMGIDFRQRVEDAFMEFDDTGEGKITRERLMDILTGMGTSPLSEDEAIDMINDCDRDGNGVFDAKELADVLCEVMDRQVHE